LCAAWQDLLDDSLHLLLEPIICLLKVFFRGPQPLSHRMPVSLEAELVLEFQMVSR
jgi:hypothetical protein